MAAAHICDMSGMSSELAVTMKVLARELSLCEGADDAELGSWGRMARALDSEDGVHFSDFIDSTRAPLELRNRSLQRIVLAARSAASREVAGDAQALAEWREVIELLVAAASGDVDADRALDAHLTAAANHGWVALEGVFRRMRRGERGEKILTGLDTFDTGVAQEALRRLAPGSSPAGG
jgi:hypothetical protein